MKTHHKVAEILHVTDVCLVHEKLNRLDRVSHQELAQWLTERTARLQIQTQALSSSTGSS